jgi:ribokinase
MDSVTVFGDINVDVLMSVPDYPRSGSDAMATQVVTRAGGSAANTGMVLAKLGVPTSMIGRTGDDQWSRIARNSLTEIGVDIQAVTSDTNASTGLIFIPVTSSGERTLFSYRGANIQIGPENINDLVITQAKVLHLSGYNFLYEPQRSATWRAIQIARNSGVQISLDVGIAPARHASGDLKKLIPHLNILVLGDTEAQALTGIKSNQRALDKLIQYGVKLVGLKLGNKGCLLSIPENTYLIPPFKVEAIDTTSAGDAFSAGLIYCRLNQMNPYATGLMANALGALATTVWGGGASFPNPQHVARFLQDQRNSASSTRDKNGLTEILEIITDGK